MDCGTDTTDPAAGCNGNGDGKISHLAAGEPTKVWEHLARAGLVEGSFDGTGTVAGSIVKLSETNIPKSKFSDAFWSLNTLPCEECGKGSPDYSDGSNLLLALGNIDPIAADPQWLYPLRSLTLQEAWNIDTKTDDGRSDTGKVRGGNANGCSDAAGDPYGIAANGTDTTTVCNLTFVLR